MRRHDGMWDNKEGEDRKGQNNDRVESSLWGGGNVYKWEGGHAPKWKHSLHQRGEARIKKNIQMRQERVIDDHNCDYKA